MAEGEILCLRPSSFTWSQETCPSVFTVSLKSQVLPLTPHYHWSAGTCWPALISVHSLLSLLPESDLHTFRAPSALNLSEQYPLEPNYKFCLWAFAYAVPSWTFSFLFPFLHHYHPVCLPSSHPVSGLNLMITIPRRASLIISSLGLPPLLGAPCAFLVATLPTLLCWLVCGHPLACLAYQLPYSPVPSTVSGTQKALVNIY